MEELMDGYWMYWSEVNKNNPDAEEVELSVKSEVVKNIQKE